jgi:hypothetical protein
MLIILAPIPEFAIGAFLVTVILPEEVEHVLAHILAEQLVPAHAASGK